MIWSHRLRSEVEVDFVRGRRLRFYVLYSSPDALALALSRVTDVAAVLSIDVVLLAALPVPFHFPIDGPPSSVECFKRVLLDQVLAFPLDVAIEVVVCRDMFAAYRQALPKGSIVLVGDRRRWWYSRGRRLAHRLGCEGHIVFLVGPEMARDIHRPHSRVPHRIVVKKQVEHL